MNGSRLSLRKSRNLSIDVNNDSTYEERYSLIRRPRKCSSILHQRTHPRSIEFVLLAQMSSPYRKWDYYDVDKEIEKIEKDTRNEALLKPQGKVMSSGNCDHNKVMKVADASIARREVEAMKSKFPINQRKVFRTVLSSLPPQPSPPSPSPQSSSPTPSSSSSANDTSSDKMSRSENVIGSLPDIEIERTSMENTLASQFVAVTDSLQKLYQLIVINSITNYQKGFNLAINILNNVCNILKLLVTEKSELKDNGGSIDTHVLHYLLTQTTSYLSLCSLNMQEYAVCINTSRMNILLNQMEYNDLKKSIGSASAVAVSSSKKNRFVEAMNWVARGCSFFFSGGYYSAYRQLLSAQAIHPTFPGLAVVLEEVTIKLRRHNSFLDKNITLHNELMFIIQRQQNYNDTCIDINNDLSLQYLDTSLYYNDMGGLLLKSCEEILSELIVDVRSLRGNIRLVIKLFYEAQTFFCESLYYTADMKYISLCMLIERMINSGLYNKKSLKLLMAACFFNAGVCRTQMISLDTLHIRNKEDTSATDSCELLHCSAKVLLLKGLDCCNCFEGMLRLAYYYEKVERYDKAFSLLSEIHEYVTSNKYVSSSNCFVWDYGKGSLLDHKFLSSPSIPLFHVNEVNQLTVGHSDEVELQLKQQSLVHKIEGKMRQIEYLMKIYL